MNGGAASACDVADDLIARHWVAAARHARKHTLQANHVDRIGGGGIWQRTAEVSKDLLTFRGVRKFADHLADRKIATAQIDEKVIVCFVSQRARQVVVV